MEGEWFSRIPHVNVNGIFLGIIMGGEWDKGI